MVLQDGDEFLQRAVALGRALARAGRTRAHLRIEVLLFLSALLLLALVHRRGERRGARGECRGVRGEGRAAKVAGVLVGVGGRGVGGHRAAALARLQRQHLVAVLQAQLAPQCRADGSLLFHLLLQLLDFLLQAL